MNEVYAILTHSQLQFFDKNLKAHERLNQAEISISRYFRFSLWSSATILDQEGTQNEIEERHDSTHSVNLVTNSSILDA